MRFFKKQKEIDTAREEKQFINRKQRTEKGKLIADLFGIELCTMKDLEGIKEIIRRW